MELDSNHGTGVLGWPHMTETLSVPWGLLLFSKLAHTGSHSSWAGIQEPESRSAQNWLRVSQLLANAMMRHLIRKRPGVGVGERKGNIEKRKRKEKEKHGSG